MAGLFKKKKSSDAAEAPGMEASLPEGKKSLSAIRTSRANVILVASAILMIAVFAMGAHFIKSNKGKQDEIRELASVTISAPIVTEEARLAAMQSAHIAPMLGSTPSSVSITDAVVGEEIMSSIALSVANAPAAVSGVAPSSGVEGLGVDNDCVDKGAITPESGCIVNVIWTPEKKETKNIFLSVRYTDPEAKDGVEKSFAIPLALASRAAEPAAQAPLQEEDDFFEDDFHEEDEAPDEEIEQDTIETEPEAAPSRPAAEPARASAPAAAASTQPKRTVYPDDCKKYASKAYDFAGVFLGWVQGNNDVFNPSCAKVIGVLQDDGNVIEAGTGKVLGRGAIMDKKKSEERRIELTLPVLNEAMNAAAGENFNPPFEDVINNRAAIKATDRPTSTEDSDLHKVDDILGIFKGQKNALIPFTITNYDQVSSMPKDERYVLRQAKPIPAVLTRPIFFSGVGLNGGAEIGQANAVAVVERNVYGGDGRTIIIPSGSQLIGEAQPPESDSMQRVNKINISWSRLIRPDGAEFDLSAVEQGSYTGDAQGRAGVPGKNDTEYMRELVFNPLLYSVLPVAMEAIFPSTSSLVTRYKTTDGSYKALDEAGEALQESELGYDVNDTQVFSEMSSRDKMKLEIQQNWKTVAQKLVTESLKQNIPFTVPAGTRINVFLGKDVMLRIDEEMNDMIQNANEHKVQ